MTCTPAHGALLRKLYRSLSPAEWVIFCRFHRSLAGRFNGESFEQLTAGELNELSGWCNRAR